MKRFINNNFTTFVMGSLTISMVSGWICLSYIQDQQTKNQPALRQPASVLDRDDGDTPNSNNNRTKSREELRLKAMVENALQSTWQENLNNAVQAHERFMLPGRDHGTEQPKFMKKIDRRVDDLVKKQNRKQKRQRQFDGLGTDTETDHDDEEDNQEDKTEFWK